MVAAATRSVPERYHASASDEAMISAGGQIEKQKRGLWQRAIVMPKRGGKEGRGCASGVVPERVFRAQPENSEN